MKLPDPDIQTGPWEQVRDGVQRNLDKLASAMPGTGGQATEIRSGTATLTFTASMASAVLSVLHGLGGVPSQVVCSCSQAGAGLYGTAAAKTDTTFSLQGFCPISISGDYTFDWFAFG